MNSDKNKKQQYLIETKQTRSHIRATSHDQPLQTIHFKETRTPQLDIDHKNFNISLNI